MILHECDPANISTADVAATVRLMNEVLAADIPEDPRWQMTMAQEYLTITMPSERRTTWTVTDPVDQTLQGRASVLLTEEIGVVELMVHPSARRHGIGSRLLAAIAHHARKEGMDLLGVEVAGDLATARFFEAYGFRRACTELRSVLTFSSVDWPRLNHLASGIGAGYRIEFYPGGPPREMYETYTLAKEALRNLNYSNIELRPSSYGPARLADSVRTLHSRGLIPYVVVAIHERTDAVAALTEVVVPAHRPTRADQYDSIVVPAHRGYGLDRATRARLLIELCACEPQLMDVQTWDSAENEQMLKVNRDLGFQTDREWWEYAIDVEDLIPRLPAGELT